MKLFDFSNPSNSLVRPLVLVLLFCLGIVVMWHLVHNVIPKSGAMASSSAPTEPREMASAREANTAAPSSVSSSQPVAETATGATRTEPQKESEALAEPLKTDKSSVAKTELPVSPAAPAEKAPRGILPRIAGSSSGKHINTEPILFNTGLAKLREVSMKPLDGLAALLMEQADLKVMIIGHTDNLGVEAANQKISAERAAAVREYLVSKGIEASRLDSKGMGSTSPIASNDTQLGRQANRRIEFLVISPK